jgi:uncharacterized protein (DUF885 family)
MKVSDVEELHRLAAEFWEWRAWHQPATSDDIPRLDRPAGWEPDWSRASVESERQAVTVFERRWAELDTSGWSINDQVDYRAIGCAIARPRWELDYQRGWERNPRFYVYQALGPVFEEMVKNKPFDAARSAAVIAGLKRAPKLIEQGKANLAGRAIRPFAEATLEILEGIGARLRDTASALQPVLSIETRAAVTSAAEQASEALEEFSSWLRHSLLSMPEDAAIGREGYRYFLDNVALMPFTPELLLIMGRQEWERSIAFEAVARERAKGLPELPLFPDQASQIAAEAREENKIRQFLEDKDLLTVPSWVRHYKNLPLPAYLEPLGHLGVLDDLTGPHRLDEDGLRYIPHPSTDIGYFELSSARDPRPLIVHEGVPGHHFQMSLAWAHENLMRRHYYDSGPNEGIGFYAEELMLNAGLFDDSPHTRQVICNFMRLRALRVEVDVSLALGIFDINRATEYLQHKTPMDYQTARAEAVFFASMPGQAITYQIGKLQIHRFLADARQNAGPEFKLRAFHDYLWKNGNLPISLLRWEYLGLDDEIAILDNDERV